MSKQSATAFIVIVLSCISFIYFENVVCLTVQVVHAFQKEVFSNGESYLSVSAKCFPFKQ